MGPLVRAEACPLAMGSVPVVETAWSEERGYTEYARG